MTHVKCLAGHLVCSNAQSLPAFADIGGESRCFAKISAALRPRVGLSASVDGSLALLFGAVEGSRGSGGGRSPLGSL